MMPMRPIVRYHGGKWQLAPWIISYFPDHRVYVEPFGGGGSVLLRKPRTFDEIYNDRDSEIVNLFRVVRDHGNELVRRIAMTPFARDEFTGCYKPSDDPIEQARRTVARSFMGFSSGAAMGCNTGFRANSRRSNTTAAKDWASLPDSVLRVVDRMRGVVIENRDALAVMRNADGPDTLHYVDPPYMHDSRVFSQSNAYRHEMTANDHEALLEGLRMLRGHVVLSGYRTDMYDDILRDWTRVDRVANSNARSERIESLWISPGSVMQGSLLMGDAEP